MLSDILTCKQVLNIMVIFGFMLNYMLRVNMTIAIVSMVIPSKDSSHSSSYNRTNECFDHEIKINVSLHNNESAMIASNSTISSFPYPPRHVRYSLSFKNSSFLKKLII